MSSWRAIAGMLLFALCWAMLEALASAVLVGYSPFQVVFMRYVTHLVVLFALVGRRAPKPLWHTRRPVFQLTRSLLMVGMPVCFVYSIRLGLGLETTTALFWLSPLMILAGSGLFLRERAPLPIWLGVAFGVAAIWLLLGWGSLPPFELALLPLGMALTFSLYVVMTRSLRTEPTGTNLFYTAFGVVLVFGPFMPSVWVTPSPVALLVMCVVGLLGLVALYSLDRSTAQAPLAHTVPFLYLQLPLYTLLEWLLGRMHIGIRVLLGACAVTVPAVCARAYVHHQQRHSSATRA